MATKEQKRRFIIGETAWNIMQQYARIAYDKDKNEVSGICCVKRVEHPVNKENVWELFEPIILKQENTGTTTELDGDALRDYYVKTGMKHGDIRFCWWHSHHTMEAFWSGTDQNEIKAWKNDSWSLALVINLFQDYKLNVCTWDPVEHSDDVPLEILRAVPQPTKVQEKEYSELCSSPKPIVTHNRSWVDGYHQVRQVGIWNNTSELKSWNKSFRPDPLASDTKLRWNKKDSLAEYGELYIEVIDEIEEMMTDYAAGTKDYKAYSEFIKAINSRLKQRNAKMTIIKHKKGELLEKTMELLPKDYINFEDKQTEEIYIMSESMIDDGALMGGNHYAY